MSRREKETVELLKEISSKLDVLNDKKEDRLFQLKMLDLQVRQNNLVFLLAMVVSVGVSFLVAYLSVAFTGVIPASLTNFVAAVIGLMYVIFVISFIVVWIMIHFVIVSRINKLRDSFQKS